MKPNPKGNELDGVYKTYTHLTMRMLCGMASACFPHYVHGYTAKRSESRLQKLSCAGNLYKILNYDVLMPMCNAKLIYSSKVNEKIITL